MPLYWPKRLASSSLFTAPTPIAAELSGVIKALTSSLTWAWAGPYATSSAAAIGSSRNPWFACMSVAPNQRRKNAGGSRFAPPSGLLLPWMSVWQFRQPRPCSTKVLTLAEVVAGGAMPAMPGVPWALWHW